MAIEAKPRPKQVSIHFLLSQDGGIDPAVRRGSTLTLKLAEREDVSGGDGVQRQHWKESLGATETGKDLPLLATIPVVECIKNQLDSGRHSKFFEDSIEIIPYRMLLNFKPFSDFAVLQAVGDEMNHFFFAPGQ